MKATTKPVKPVKPTVKKPTVKPPTTTKPTKRPNYTPADFKQCGGSGNNCQGSKVRVLMTFLRPLKLLIPSSVRC